MVLEHRADIDWNAPAAVYVAFEAFPRAKGASVHIGSMLRALATDFSPVLCLCLGYGDMPAFQQEGNIEIRRFKEYHPNMLKRAQGFALFVADQMAALARPPRLAVFRDPWGGHPMLQHGGCPMIFEVNGLPSWELGYTYPQFSANPSLVAKVADIEQYCLQNSAAILAVSQVARGALGERGVPQDRIEVIPNCASDLFFEAGQARSKQSAPSNVIGYFGSVHPWQGIEHLIDAFALLGDTLPDHRLQLVCGGSKVRRKALRKRIRKNGLAGRATLMEPRPQAELSAMVSQMAFTVAPLTETPRNTHQGCCPLKVVESMAAGTPVIASDLRVVRELMTHQQQGILVPPGEPRALALAMQNLARDIPLQAELSKRARLHAEDSFTETRIHGTLRKLFGRMAKG